MQLKALEANQKALNNMEDNYKKIMKLTMAVATTDAGTRDHEEALIKLRAMQFAQARDRSSFERTQGMLGRSSAETKAALSGLGTGFSQKVMGATGGVQAYAASGMSATDFASNLVKTIAANPMDLTGKIFVHVKADGSVDSSATFPGSKVGGVVSAQSTKNGGTRK
jgi:hypothetical protein